jgi:hypothetical protein
MHTVDINTDGAFWRGDICSGDKAGFHEPFSALTRKQGPVMVQVWPHDHMMNFECFYEHFTLL